MVMCVIALSFLRDPLIRAGKQSKLHGHQHEEKIKYEEDEKSGGQRCEDVSQYKRSTHSLGENVGINIVLLVTPRMTFWGHFLNSMYLRLDKLRVSHIPLEYDAQEEASQLDNTGLVSFSWK